MFLSWVPVAHTYNPSYSGGRDQEDHGSKPAQANSSRGPILKKKKITKIGLVEWLKKKECRTAPWSSTILTSCFYRMKTKIVSASLIGY
jgi:hypothetical protein